MSDKIQALNRQINELNKRIDELMHHKEQLDLVIKATGVGIWDWKVQTGELSLNERWANIIGYSLAEISPTSVETWIQYAHPDDLELSDRLLKEHWAGESEYYIFESRMKHKNGSWIWVYDTGRVTEWESEGVPKRMVGTHVDITEQKNTQFRLDGECKKNCVSGILTTLLKGQQNANIRRAYCSTSGGLLQP